MAITLGITGLKEARRRYQRLSTRFPIEAKRAVLAGAQRGRTEFLRRTAQPAGLSTLKRSKANELVGKARATGGSSAGFKISGRAPRIQHYAGTTITRRRPGRGGVAAFGRVGFRTKRNAARSRLRGFAVLRGGEEVWIRRQTPTDIARRRAVPRNPKYKIGTMAFSGYPLSRYALDPIVFRPVQARMLSVLNRELDTRIKRLMR